MLRFSLSLNAVRSLRGRAFSSGAPGPSKAARAGVAVAAVSGAALLAYSQVPDGYNYYSFFHVGPKNQPVIWFEWNKNGVEMACSNGAVYRGAVKDGKFHGRGKLTWPDGTVYECEFKHGKAHGRGKVTWANGKIYEGELIDDTAHGRGKLTLAGVAVYEGEFKRDTFCGRGKLTQDNGRGQGRTLTFSSCCPRPSFSLHKRIGHVYYANSVIYL